MKLDMLYVKKQYLEIRTNSDDQLPLGKTLNMHNVVMLIESGFNKNHNH